MSKSSKPRRTARQKLLDEVSQTRQVLVDAARDRHAAEIVPLMFPNYRLDVSFNRYSRALRGLVRYDLKAPGWDIAEAADSTSSWRWDDDVEFDFDYETWADLPHTEHELVNSRAPRIRCTVRLTFDPNKPLDEELKRVATEAKHYRDCVALMTREARRLVVRADHKAEQTQETP